MELTLKRRQTEDLESSRSKSVGGSHGNGHEREREGDTISKDWASTRSGFEGDLDGAKAYKVGVSKVAVVHGLNRPLFHMDLTSALQSAIANVERRREEEDEEAARREGEEGK